MTCAQKSGTRQRRRALNAMGSAVASAVHPEMRTHSLRDQMNLPELLHWAGVPELEPRFEQESVDLSAFLLLDDEDLKQVLRALTNTASSCLVICGLGFMLFC